MEKIATLDRSPPLKQSTDTEPSMFWSRCPGHKAGGGTSKAGAMNETQDGNTAAFVAFNTLDDNSDENEMHQLFPELCDVQSTLSSRNTNPTATETQTSSPPSEDVSILEDSVFAAPGFLELDMLWADPECSLSEENP